jgi:predicted peptidase
MTLQLITSPAIRPASLIVLFLLAAGCNRLPLPAAAVANATPTPLPEPGQHPQHAVIQVDRNEQGIQEVPVNYLLYLPAGYGREPGKEWPLILFLHGRGERGDDLALLKRHPLPEMLARQADFPFIVVSPQLSLDQLWWSAMIDPLNTLLDQVVARYAVDSRRIYLTGLSMGGFGTWEFALRYPERFAAIVPIAGGWQEYSLQAPQNICALKNVPTWVFYGAQDTIVNPMQSQVLVAALQACGGEVRSTVYPDADHEGSWRRAYADPQLYAWLLEHSLK